MRKHVQGSGHGAKVMYFPVFYPTGWWLIGYLEGQSESQGSQFMMRKLRSDHKAMSFGSQEKNFQHESMSSHTQTSLILVISREMGIFNFSPLLFSCFNFSGFQGSTVLIHSSMLNIRGHLCQKQHQQEKFRMYFCTQEMFVE